MSSDRRRRRAPCYGQVVVGPPGSGKTTFCNGMQQYLRLLGRDAWVINLDPANEAIETSKDDKDAAIQKLPYETLLNVCDDFCNLTSVMRETGLGPNGGLMYCMEYLESHLDELVNAIDAKLLDNRKYLLLDFPGQVELYTHSTCVQSMLATLVKRLDLRLTAVQLVDAQYCTDATKFLSAALLGTTTMIRLELPAVNVLSKVDLLTKYGELPMQLDFFLECQELDRLVPFLEHQGPISRSSKTPTNGLYEDEDDFELQDAIAQDPELMQARRDRRQHSKFFKKFTKLHESMAEVVSDFGLLDFIPLDVTKADSMGRVLARIDKCNGYVFLQHSTSPPQDLMFQCAVQNDLEYEGIADIQERLNEP